MSDLVSRAVPEFERLAAALAGVGDLSLRAQAATLQQGPIAAVLDNIDEGIAILDRDWRVMYANLSAQRFTGMPGADAIGRTLWELFPAASASRFGAEYRRAVGEAVPVHFEEFYPEPLNKWYEVRAYPSADGLALFFRDTTERRRTESALRESEERYRSLFSSMTEGFALHEIVCDDQGVPRDYRFLDINPAFETLTGLSRGDVVGRLMSEILPTEDPHWVEAYGAVALTGQPIHFDHFSPALGRHYDVFSYRPAPGQFAVLFHDITDRKRLEEALRVNLTKYTVLFDSFPLGISVTDGRGELLEANREAERLLGLSEREHTARRIDGAEWRIIRLDGSPMPAAEFASVRALEEQRLVENVEMGVARPDGEVTWLSVTAAPLPLDGYGVVITYGDISSRRRTEEQLEAAHREVVAAKARLEAVMDALPAGLAILDAEGGLVRWNAAYDRIWGAPRPHAAAVGDYARFRAWWIDTGREVQPHEWASARAVQHGETITGQVLEIQKFDGGRAFVLNSAAPVLDADRRPVGCAVAIQDISRRVEAERALARSEAALHRANDELQAANDALTRQNETLELAVQARTADLAGRTAQLQALARDLTRAEERERQRVARVIHDDLQQLLSVARITLGMALDKGADPSCRSSIREADRMVAESLDITRSLTAELSPAILHRAGIATALRWLARWFEERFALSVKVEADEDPQVEEEVRVALFRSVRELLFNVVKHARVTRATVALRRAADLRLMVVVSDEGVGFDPAEAQRRETAGGSFGLFSLRQTLDLLGGRLDIDSRPGQGASFTVVAPDLARMPEASPAIVLTPSVPAPRPRRRASGPGPKRRRPTKAQ